MTQSEYHITAPRREGRDWLVEVMHGERHVRTFAYRGDGRGHLSSVAERIKTLTEYDWLPLEEAKAIAHAATDMLTEAAGQGGRDEGRRI